MDYAYVLVVLLTSQDPMRVEIPVRDCAELGNWMVRANAWAERSQIPFADRPFAVCGPRALMQVPHELGRDRPLPDLWQRQVSAVLLDRAGGTRVAAPSRSASTP